MVQAQAQAQAQLMAYPTEPFQNQAQLQAQLQTQAEFQAFPTETFQNQVSQAQTQSSSSSATMTGSENYQGFLNEQEQSQFQERVSKAKQILRRREPNINPEDEG